MGVQDGTQFLKPDGHTWCTHSLKSIRKLHPDGDNDPNPFVAVDLSLWVVRALKTDRVCAEFFMEPKVPVKYVSEYVFERLRLLRKNKLEPILVADGQRYPPKSDTNHERYKDRPLHLAELQDAYESTTTTFGEIRAKQKKSHLFPRRYSIPSD